MHYPWWQILFFAIGIITFIAAIAVLFFPIAAGPDEITCTAECPPVENPDFLKILATFLNCPISHGSRIQILNNGDEFLESLLNDFKQAKHSINLMAYVWEDGDMSDRLLSALTEKLQEGVTVRVMLDAFGGLHSPRAKFTEFKEKGGKVAIFHALSIAPWNLSHTHKRNHRRAITIDGQIGYLGGIAVADKWLGNAASKDQWRDMMFRVVGTMALSVQGAFAELWTGKTGELLTDTDSFPTTKNEDTSVTYLPVFSSPIRDTLLLEKFLYISFLGARQRIYITSPYFLPDKALRKLLQQKASAGVDVRILVPNKLNDTPEVRYASRFFYARLMKAGIKIYEYQPSFIHSKYIAIDGHWAVIGSANMDNRSRKINAEFVFGLANADFTGKIEQTFFADIVNAEEIQMAEWVHRSLWNRFRELFAQLFIKQY